MRILKLRTKFLVAFAALGMLASGEAQTLYRAGDIVADFTLTERGTGKVVSLSDFEGKIVFLEWFTHWCPFCQAAAAVVKPGVVDQFANGNQHGVPVLHVSVNLQAGAETQTQNFINFYKLGYVAEDFNRAVANRFATGGQPIFAIINGVANSPSHKQYELVYSHLGFGNLNAPIASFQAAINSVRAGVAEVAPSIELGPVGQRVASGSQVEFSVVVSDVSGVSYQWRRNAEPIPDSNSAVFRIEGATIEDAGTYDVVVTRSSLHATSGAAELVVIESLADYLRRFEVPEWLAAPEADADGDGYANVLEYLLRSDPGDVGRVPYVDWRLPQGNLSIAYDAGVVIGYALRVQFSRLPSFADLVEVDLSEGKSGAATVVDSPLYMDDGSVFARLLAREN